MAFFFTVPLWLGVLIWILQAIGARQQAETATRRIVEGTKTCPDCAEPIRVAARVCRYCGCQQPPMLVADRPWTPARKEPASMLRQMCWIVVCVVAGAFVLGALGTVHQAHADTGSVLALAQR